MDDLISRQQAIDALDGELTITGRTNAEVVRGYVRLVKDRLERLPSATDTNVGIKLGTNLAEVGTDCISRQAAIDICNHAVESFTGQFGAGGLTAIRDDIAELPSAQPKIIHCKDCKYRNPFIKDTAPMWLPCMAIDTDDMWFCGYGE